MIVNNRDSDAIAFRISEAMVAVMVAGPQSFLSFLSSSGSSLLKAILSHHTYRPEHHNDRDGEMIPSQNERKEEASYYGGGVSGGYPCLPAHPPICVCSPSSGVPPSGADLGGESEGGNGALILRTRRQQRAAVQERMRSPKNAYG